jgi:hypothetical protein
LCCFPVLRRPPHNARATRWASQDKGDKEDKLKFECDHLTAYQLADLQWPPKYDNEIASQVAHLPVRSAEVAYYIENIFRRDVHLHESAHDLAKNISWHGGTASALNTWLPCITSSARLWFRQARRDMTGPEVFGVVGSISRKAPSRHIGPHTCVQTQAVGKTHLRKVGPGMAVLPAAPGLLVPPGMGHPARCRQGRAAFTALPLPGTSLRGSGEERSSLRGR